MRRQSGYLEQARTAKSSQASKQNSKSKRARARRRKHTRSLRVMTGGHRGVCWPLLLGVRRCDPSPDLGRASSAYAVGWLRLYGRPSLVTTRLSFTWKPSSSNSSSRKQTYLCNQTPRPNRRPPPDLDAPQDRDAPADEDIVLDDDALAHVGAPSAVAPPRVRRHRRRVDAHVRPDDHVVADEDLAGVEHRAVAPDHRVLADPDVVAVVARERRLDDHLLADTARVRHGRVLRRAELDGVLGHQDLPEQPRPLDRRHAVVRVGRVVEPPAGGVATIAVPTIRRSETAYKTLSASLCTLHSAGLNLDWNEFHRDFSGSVRILDLPSYSFDEKNYWLQYTGDWSLTKNRAAIVAAPVAVEPAKPKLSTTSVQKILSEEVKDGIATVEIESNLSREDLRLAVTGHQVNGAPLCPSSLYGDMAMTVCDYAYKLVRPDTEKIGCNVAHMKVPKSLIFDETLEQHILRLKVTANIAAGHADLVFSSGDGAKKIDHATCKVYYKDIEEWSSEFERADYLIKGRIEALMAAEKAGKASKIGRGLAYKLFAALVDYDRRYRGMEEVILDSDTCEATARVHFQTSDKDGSYHFSPFWIDSLCHISGFIINGTDAVDSREQVFISHGWESMRFLETPVLSKEYRSYIRMQPLKGTKMMAGDVYVFDGDRLIGITGGICFQAIPRKVLNIMLPPRGAMKTPQAVATRPTFASQPARNSVPAKEKRVLTPSNIVQVNRKLVSVTSQVMDILAKEVGVSHDELADNIAFADLGVDSLMGLTVSGRIREDLDLNIDSHVFVDHPTISSFKLYLQQFERPGASEPPSSGDSADSSSENETPEPTQSDSGVTTPESIDMKSGAPVEGANAGLQAAIRETIASEMCVEVEEIIAAPDLANLGMDSLMSLSILGTLRERTGLNIPSDLFVSNPSLKDVERALGIEEAPRKPTTPKPAAVKHVKFGAPKPASTNEPLPPSMVLATIPKPPRPSRIVDDYPNRKASSVLLQGSHRTATKNLFMIPDGSGSATSYTEISEISPSWAVWGLFSPFLKTPEEFHCGVYGMATKFIDEMKRRQPVGPYSLAGWSAGGVISYEIVVQLTQAGELVENLIIIDAPCPVTIEALPASLHAWFASIGLLGDGDEKKIPPWLLPHFAASVTALSNYTAEPIPNDKCPKVMVIWCEDGVCHLPTDPRPDPYPTGHALFLLDNRTDFGPNRWDGYMDVNKMTMRHMPGNHFSMMHGDLAKQLGSLMREALL